VAPISLAESPSDTDIDLFRRLVRQYFTSPRYSKPSTGSSTWPTSKSPTDLSRRSAGGETKDWVLWTRWSPSSLPLPWSAFRSKISQLSRASATATRIPLRWYLQPLCRILHLVLPAFSISRPLNSIPLPYPRCLHLWLLPNCNMGLNRPHHKHKHKLHDIFLQNPSRSRSRVRYLLHHWPTLNHKSIFTRPAPSPQSQTPPHKSQRRHSFRK
jgi:hypothetical protein